GQRHRHLPTLDRDAQRAEIAGPVELLASRYGVHATLFRPPYGEYDDQTRKTVAELGLRFVLWTVASGDPAPSLSAEKMLTALGGREGFVLETDARVVGLALVRPRFLVGDYLELFVVDAGVRGQGLGAVLLEHVERVTFGRGQNLFVCVSDFNAGARRFYARQG